MVHELREPLDSLVAHTYIRDSWPVPGKSETLYRKAEGRRLKRNPLGLARDKDKAVPGR